MSLDRQAIADTLLGLWAQNDGLDQWNTMADYVIRLVEAPDRAELVAQLWAIYTKAGYDKAMLEEIADLIGWSGYV
ncbi:MAG: hypothetical protein U1C74_15935 [Phenylobacterium sp.]|nr:hypothetical protein [Candidatus Omnitrophota bacterium]MDZ4372899.1 hypothetical protein [Phenylobacterium sp.]